jgi:hypothetical protein
VTLYPNGGALYLASLMRTALALSTLHLYKAISSPLNPGTTLANLTEADYDGYALKTITAWLTPYLDPLGGATIQSGTQQFDFVSVPLTTNTILGFYLLNAAGALVFVGNFDAPIAMAANGDAIPVNVSLNFGAPAV